MAVYGLSPGPDVGTAAGLGLRPAMRLTAHVGLAKQVPADQGVSYAHRYRTTSPTTLALVPLGYADGVPRHATNVGPVQINGKLRDRIQAPRGSSEEELVRLAREAPRVAAHLDGRTIVKTIVVPDKLVNFVVR